MPKRRPTRRSRRQSLRSVSILQSSKNHSHSTAKFIFQPFYSTPALPPLAAPKTPASLKSRFLMFFVNSKTMRPAALTLRIQPAHAPRGPRTPQHQAQPGRNPNNPNPLPRSWLRSVKIRKTPTSSAQGRPPPRPPEAALSPPMSRQRASRRLTPPLE